MPNKVIQFISAYGKLFIALPLVLLLSSCSTSESQVSDTINIPGYTSNNSYTFYTDEDGEEVRVDVELKKGGSTEIYRNGVRQSGSKKDYYADLAEDELSGLYGSLSGKGRNERIKIHFDKDFAKNMRRLNDKIKNDIKIHIDKDKIKSELEGARKEMENVRKLRININADIKKEMKELREELKDLHVDMDDIEVHWDDQKFDFDFDFDFDSLFDGLEHVGKIEVDLSGLDESMKNLEIELEGLDEKMEEVKIEMKKLESFMDELKSGLVEDGYISNKEDEFELDLDADKMEVNGNAVSDVHFQKYKSLYEKHFGKELEGGRRFRIRK